jgi:hypothetical protein
MASTRLPFVSAPDMYVLYLDDAGSQHDPNHRYFVLGGVAIFERQTHFLDQSLGEIAAKIDPLDWKELEFHAGDMLSGRGRWRKLGDRTQRRRYLADCLKCIDDLRGQRALFAAVIEKSAVSPEDAAEYAFEQLCRRFDHYLGRFYKKGNTQRGLVVLDKSTLETRLQRLTREFRLSGHRWGKLKNFIDVPFFVDSRATRLIQFADMVAHATWRSFEKGDDAFFRIIETAFDAEGGIRHGLFVKRVSETREEAV